MKELLDQLEEIVYVIDLETHQLRYMNAACQRLAAIRSDGDCLGKPCYRALIGADAPCPECVVLTAEQHPVGSPFLVREHTNNYLGGHYILKEKLIEWRGRLSRLEVAIDITERENLSRAIRHKLEIEEILLACSRSLSDPDGSSEGIAEALRHIGDYYRADRAYIFEIEPDRWVHNSYEWCAPGVKPEMERLQNLTLEDVDRWLLIMKDGKPVIIPEVEELRTASPGEYRVLAAQGIRSLSAVRLCPGGAERITGFIGLDNPRNTPEDITLLESLSFFIDAFLQKQKLVARLRRMSYLDSLTGLFNFNRYAERLAELAAAPPRKLGMALVDINGLKQVNDRCGRRYGDSCLVRTAELLLECFGPERVFRTGDDEFTVLWPDCGETRFDAAVCRLRELSGREYCSLSIGKVWSGREVRAAEMAENAEQLLSLDKQRAYEAERLGNYHRKSPMLDGLLEALRDGRFEVYLQAKYRARDRRLCGAEALIRHHSDEYGFVSPGVFIPIFEREMIVKHVDFFVFREVCRMLARWLERFGGAVPVSVNFSRVTLMESDFVETLLGIWEKYPVPKRLIELEVTESADKMGLGPLLSLIGRLRDTGFRVSLDDFGSQYTNLQMLMEINVDVLKIDQSLISRIEEGDKNRVLLDYIFRFCSRMGLCTVAEGVENNKQYELLRDMGCDCIQGYLFAKPVPVEGFEQLLSEKLPDCPEGLTPAGVGQ